MGQVADRSAIAAAADILITDEDAVGLFKQLTGVYELARKGVPVRMVGGAEPLNPLLSLWLADEERAHRVFDLVNRKRDELDLGHLGDSDFNRRSYMREFMAQKRERGRRIVELTNMLRSEREKLRGAGRMEFERAHANRWYEVKKEREEALRKAKGERLTSDELRQITTTLWADVDDELLEYERFVRSEVRKPLNQRTDFKFRLVPKKGKKK